MIIFLSDHLFIPYYITLNTKQIFALKYGEAHSLWTFSGYEVSFLSAKQDSKLEYGSVDWSKWVLVCDMHASMNISVIFSFDLSISTKSFHLVSFACIGMQHSWNILFCFGHVGSDGIFLTIVKTLCSYVIAMKVLF